MKRNQVVTSIFALMLFACLFGVEGQYYTSPQTSGDQYAMSPLTATSPTVQYSQYYTMGQAPNAHVTAPQQVDLTGNLPATVYFGFDQQPVPFSQYQSDPAFATAILYDTGPSSWTQYASVPPGASLAFLAFSSTGGNGYLYEIYPNDQCNERLLFFPGYVSSGSTLMQWPTYTAFHNW